jgi:hypothetical protein
MMWSKATEPDTTTVNVHVSGIIATTRPALATTTGIGARFGRWFPSNSQV